MFTPFVTDEKPLAIYKGVPPQYTSDGLAINCALILHVLKGTAKVLCNFDIIEETAGSVVLFNPGDVIKVQQRSEDYEVEILAVSKFFQLAARNQLEDVATDAFNNACVVDSPELSAATGGMFRFMAPVIGMCDTKEQYQVSVPQLKSFYMLFRTVMRNNGKGILSFKNHKDELFFRFRQLLGKHYRESRNVSYYADKLCITTRYLSEIVKNRYGKSPKEAIDIFTVMQVRLDLLQSDIPLSELAWKYNFPSLSFFSDYFKRNTGMTPQEYRMANRRNQNTD